MSTSSEGSKFSTVYTHCMGEYQVDGRTGGVFIDVLVSRDKAMAVLFRPYQRMATTGEYYPAAVSRRQIDEVRRAAAGAIAAERLRLRTALTEVL